eukprot:GHRQ01020244.1.p2 GENE.GHRQ01020244.1~~GHRQ01020244.1.p2  ORF type:complete len:117 (-),score=51.77 GHRQ01020244.1:1305-1655(-)
MHLLGSYFLASFCAKSLFFCLPACDRFACGPEGMNRGLVLRYMELSCLLLVPITPHTCEHVWGALLQKQGSVLRAGWPAAAEPDFIMQRAAQYIEGELRALEYLLCYWLYVVYEDA